MKQLLELEHEQLRALGQQVLEMCLAYWSQVQAGKVWDPPDAKELDRQLRKALPEQPGDATAVLQQLRETVFAAQAHLAHPRFFGFVPSAGNFVSALGDLMVSVHNPFAGSWLEGAGAQTIERTVIEWLAKEVGFPFGSGGVFLSGGSIGNMTAIIAARDWKFNAGTWSRGAIYFWTPKHCGAKWKRMTVTG
jgi:glutamate/tyrosine decarboxylase-like PLP-dependent enzyme